MKKIKYLMLVAVAAMASVMSFTSCDKDTVTEEKVVERFNSEFSKIDDEVAATKAESGHNKAILLVAFGSTWNNAFLAFDRTKAEYQKAFPDYDVYISFSSDICINRAHAGENVDDEGNIVKRDYYAPNYWLHGIGKAQYSEIRVQSLQVIPGEEFAAVVACVKKFANNGYIFEQRLDDKYLSEVEIHLGLPLLTDPEDVVVVADELNKLYVSEATQGVVAFMGHGNPDSYDTFKANGRYRDLQEALQVYSPNYYVGTVDAPGMHKEDVLNGSEALGVGIKTNPATGAFKSGKMFLHALMSIAGDHAHNDMIGEGEEYWDEDEPESEDNSWLEYFNHNGFNAEGPAEGTHPLGLLELEGVRNVWINHTKDAELLEDAYHSMYPEE